MERTPASWVCWKVQLLDGADGCETGAKDDSQALCRNSRRMELPSVDEGGCGEAVLEAGVGAGIGCVPFTGTHWMSR